MTLGLLGTGPAADARRASLDRLGRPPAWTGEALDEAPALDAVVVAGAAADRPAGVRAALARGVAVFAEWPPAPSLREARALAEWGEEAGVEVGVARPWRFAPALAALAEPARLVVLRRTVPEGAPLLAGHALADLADLALALTHATGVRRLDAVAVRDRLRAPRALAFTVRFPNGALVQASLAAGPAGRFEALVVTPTATFDLDLTGTLDAARDRETAAFLDAAARGAPPPVTALDALQSLRLAERLAARMR